MFRMRVLWLRATGAQEGQADLGSLQDLPSSLAMPMCRSPGLYPANLFPCNPPPFLPYRTSRKMSGNPRSAMQLLDEYLGDTQDGPGISRTGKLHHFLGIRASPTRQEVEHASRRLHRFLHGDRHPLVNWAFRKYGDDVPVSLAQDAQNILQDLYAGEWRSAKDRLVTQDEEIFKRDRG